MTETELKSSTWFRKIVTGGSPISSIQKHLSSYRLRLSYGGSVFGVDKERE